MKRFLLLLLALVLVLLAGVHLEVGSEWRLVFAEDELIEKVTAVEPARRHAFDMRTGVFVFTKGSLEGRAQEQCAALKRLVESSPAPSPSE